MLQRRGLMVAGSALAIDCLAPRARAGVPGTIIFSQPSLPNGIAGNFSATGAQPAYNPVGAFYIHYNQLDPFNQGHSFAPVRWAAGELTGL